MSELTYSLNEQLKLHIENPEEFDNIWPHCDWCIMEYRRLFDYIEEGWIIQGNGGFIVNPDWTEDPLWEEPCDRCPSSSMSWCQSNGCEKGQDRIESMTEQGIIVEKK